MQNLLLAYCCGFLLEGSCWTNPDSYSPNTRESWMTCIYITIMFWTHHKSKSLSKHHSTLWDYGNEFLVFIFKSPNQHIKFPALRTSVHSSGMDRSVHHQDRPPGGLGVCLSFGFRGSNPRWSSWFGLDDANEWKFIMGVSCKSKQFHPTPGSKEKWVGPYSDFYDNPLERSSKENYLLWGYPLRLSIRSHLSKGPSPCGTYGASLQL